MLLKGIFGLPAVDPETGNNIKQYIGNAVITFVSTTGEYSTDVSTLGYYEINLPEGGYFVKAYIKGGSQTISHIRQGVEFIVSSTSPENAFDLWVEVSSVGEPDPILAQWIAVKDEMKDIKDTFVYKVENFGDNIEEVYQGYVTDLTSLGDTITSSKQNYIDEIDAKGVEVLGYITSAEEASINKIKTQETVSVKAVSDKESELVTSLNTKTNSLKTELNTHSNGLKTELTAEGTKQVNALNDKIVIATPLVDSIRTAELNAVTSINTLKDSQIMALNNKNTEILNNISVGESSLNNVLETINDAEDNSIQRINLKTEVSIAEFISATDLKINEIQSVIAEVQPAIDLINNTEATAVVAVNTAKDLAIQEISNIEESFLLNITGVSGQNDKLAISQKYVTNEFIRIDTALGTKQDVLTFTGTGAVVRNSALTEAMQTVENNIVSIGTGKVVRETELDKKQDTLEFVGTGKVLKESEIEAFQDALTKGAYNSTNTVTDSHGVIHVGLDTPIDTLNTSDLTDHVRQDLELPITSSAVYGALGTDKLEYIGTGSIVKDSELLKKQDSLNFVGEGDVVRKSELDKKQNTLEFVGTGKVLKENAYGVGGHTSNSNLKSVTVNGFVRTSNNVLGSSIFPDSHFYNGYWAGYASDVYSGIFISRTGASAYSVFKSSSSEVTAHMLHTSGNTSVDRNGVIHEGTTTPIDTLTTSDLTDHVQEGLNHPVTSAGVRKALDDLKVGITEEDLTQLITLDTNKAPSNKAVYDAIVNLQERIAKLDNDLTNHIREKLFEDYNEAESANTQDAMFVRNTDGSTKYIPWIYSGAMNLSEVKEIISWGKMSSYFNYNYINTQSLTKVPYFLNPNIISIDGLLGEGITQNLETWDVSKIEVFTSLFSKAQNFTGYGKWDMSNAKNMSQAFMNYRNSVEDISNWNMSNVTNMQGMFSGATNFNQDISKWDTSKVTNMANMFSRASSFNQDLSTWNVLNVTNMANMFSSATSFNSDISNWNVSKVTDMSYIFFSARSFNSDISKWDTSKVTNMANMFFSATSFNQDLSTWNVLNVTNMSYMFFSATSFNQDLSKWCVSLITSTPSNFSTSSRLSIENSPVWGTCPRGEIPK